MHEDQLDVVVAAVRELVDGQFPQWSALSLTAVRSIGTVNALFRLGENLTLRFPLQRGDAREIREQLEQESRAAAELHGRVPFPTPQPIAIGNPGPGYPLPWSIQSWVPGAVAALDDTSASAPFAKDLARLIKALREIPTAGRVFQGTGRGGDLRSSDGWMEECFQRSEGLVAVATLRSLWNELVDLPRSAPDVMCHGDLTPGNLLVGQGRLVGVIDVGGFGPADPALDLVSAWHLLDADRRHILRREVSTDDTEWARGKAWALEQAMGAVWYYRQTNPAMHAMGRTTLARIVEDTA